MATPTGKQHGYIQIPTATKTLGLIERCVFLAYSGWSLRLEA